MERLVVRAVARNEIVDAGGVEGAHLLEQARTADRGENLLVGHVDAEHVLGGMLEGREDHRPGVDQRAVEVEENGLVTHVRVIVSTRFAPAARLSRVVVGSPHIRHGSGTLACAFARYRVLRGRGGPLGGG